MLNPFCLVRDGSVTLGPLITVIRSPELLEKGASRKSTESFRNHNMIYESDAVILTFTDSLSDDDRKSLKEIVASVNPDAKIVFFSEGGEGAEDVSDLVFGDSVYHRPLEN